MLNEFLGAVGLNIETFIILIIICVSVIAMAVDYRLSLITLLFLTVVAIIFLTLVGYAVNLLLVLMGLAIVLMAMAIFVSRNQERVIA
jgi:hypothetical protein